VKFAPKRGWTLNGLRFVSPGMHGETEFFHVNDFPVYAAAPAMLKALMNADKQLTVWMVGAGEGVDCLAEIQAAIALAKGKA
jgi:hypothetical protein